MQAQNKVHEELALAYWTISGALAMTGGGRWSLDRKLFCRCAPSEEGAEKRA